MREPWKLLRRELTNKRQKKTRENEKKQQVRQFARGVNDRDECQAELNFIRNHTSRIPIVLNCTSNGNRTSTAILFELNLFSWNIHGRRVISNTLAFNYLSLVVLHSSKLRRLSN